jgi:beta-phosphoglucomutase
MPWPSAVLFDFDGVIVNSEPLHFLAFTYTLAEFDITLSELEYYDELIGFDDRGAVKYIFAKHRRTLDPKTLLAVLTRKSRLMRDLIEQRKFSALPGVEELVRGLWRHYPLAICSGALREEIETMLLGINLRDCFSVITAAEDVTAGKPDPMGYLLTAKQIGEKTKKDIKPADCLIIEDAPSVVESTKAAGFQVMAVATSYPPEKLTQADWVVKSLEPDAVKAKIPKLKLEI